MGSPLVIGEAQFEAEVLQSEKPVMVYFWAAWCGPCRLMAPMMEKLAASHGDQIKIVKMEVDPNPQVVAKYKVEGVPALRFFRAGDLQSSAEGAISPAALEALVNNHLAA
ncbi:MAG: thioredoxin [Alkalinema sp. RU_4_3]|nr:thioredoxin [Alkalinema sp. RU_4_3]